MKILFENPKRIEVGGSSPSKGVAFDLRICNEKLETQLTIAGCRILWGTLMGPTLAFKRPNGGTGYKTVATLEGDLGAQIVEELWALRWPDAFPDVQWPKPKP